GGRKEKRKKKLSFPTPPATPPVGDPPPIPPPTPTHLPNHLDPSPFLPLLLLFLLVSNSQNPPSHNDPPFATPPPPPRDPPSRPPTHLDPSPFLHLLLVLVMSTFGGLKNVLQAVLETKTLQKVIYTSSFFALSSAHHEKFFCMEKKERVKSCTEKEKKIKVYPWYNFLEIS
ncbi:hypothetical protein D8674_029024, partial [Pyrus ussuriensis x Pyrus communis]